MGQRDALFSVGLGCALSVSTARIAANSIGVQINEAVISAFYVIVFLQNVTYLEPYFRETRQEVRSAIFFDGLLCGA